MPGRAKLLKLLDPEIRAKNLRAAHLAARGLWWDLCHPAMPDPVFVIGCSRSGTTVTYETLAGTPQFLSFGYELPQFWNGCFGLTQFFARIQAVPGPYPVHHGQTQ